ncbi:MAG: hypothetical protein V3S11_01090 [Elusimicrobiota bacterium]
MSFWSRLFGRAEGDENRGCSAENPLLARSPSDEREILDKLRCPNGHRFDFRRLGSVGGRCPEPASHRSVMGDRVCIVDKYQLNCQNGEFSCELFFDMYHPERSEPAPPKGLRKDEPEHAKTRRSVVLHYEDGFPAWRLRTVQPSRFKKAPYEIHVRVFCLPEGALIGMLLNLYDIPDQPYFIHRVLDISDPEVARYVEACGKSGRIIALFESKGEEESFQRDIKLDAQSWRRCLQQGRAHNESIQADGDRALESFLGIFHKISRERGIEPAWKEVERRCVQKRRK